MSSHTTTHSKSGSLQSGLSVQIRVVSALITREIQTRYGRKNMGYVWALIEPVMLLLMFVFLFTYRGHTEFNGMNMVSFLTTGIMTFLAMRKIVGNVCSATKANKGLLLYPQVTPIDTMVARIILDSTTAIVVFAIIISFSWMIDTATLPHDLLGVIIAFYAMSLMGVSIGLAQNALITLWPVADRLLAPLWRFLFFTSCVFFSMQDIPLQFQEILIYNPIANIIELLRSAWFPNFYTPVKGYWYVIQVSSACMFMGLLIERMYRFRGIST